MIRAEQPAQAGIRLPLTDNQRRILREHATNMGTASLVMAAFSLMEHGYDALHKDDPGKKPRFIPRPRRKSA